MWDLRPNLVSKEGKNGEGQEEKEKKKRREEEREIKKYGYMTFVWILVRFGMDLWISCMEFEGFVWLMACPQI